MRAIDPVGRVLFALIFVASVVGHLSGAEIAEASAHGVPFATIVVPLSLGAWSRSSAAYASRSATARGSARSNTSLIGACLLIMHSGSGPYSLDS